MYSRERCDDETQVTYEGKGIGRSLVDAVVGYGQVQGFIGVAAIGTRGHMPASFFEHLGFRTVDRQEDMRLVWRRLTARPMPRLLKTRIHPTVAKDKVHVDCVYSSFCNCRDSLRIVCDEYGSCVVLHEHVVDDRECMEIDCGANCSAVYVDGVRGVNSPIGTDNWRQLIEEALQRKGL